MSVAVLDVPDLFYLFQILARRHACVERQYSKINIKEVYV